MTFYSTTLFPMMTILTRLLMGSASLLAGQTSAAWSLSEAPDIGAEGPRILVYHDMEGLCGQSNPDSYFFSKPEYARGQEMLAADINAVVAGLFDGGARLVHIVDGHGSGNPEPDLRTDLLDSRARQVFRPEPFDAYMDLSQNNSYDAIAVVGMHAKTGSGGFASHTITLGMAVYLNHQSITETELIGLSWGRVDTPVIFASGDDRLEADLRPNMPWIEYVTVKKARGGGDATPRPVDEARADMRSAASRAVGNIGLSRVMKIKTPITATLQAVPPASLTMMSGVPGIDYENGRVTFEAADLKAAYDGLSALIGVATGGYSRHGMAAMSRDGGPSIRERFFDALVQVWIDQESGVLEQTSPNSTAGDTEDRTPRYHGYR